MSDDVRAAAERLKEFARIASQGTPSQAPAYWDAAYMAVYNGTPHRRLGDMTAVADAYLAANPPDDGWRPIETAPRDGTHVLVGQFGGEPGFGRCGDPPRGQWWQAVAHYFDTGTERGFYLSSGGADTDAVKPTHWRPLPDPPKVGEPAKA